MSVELAQCPCGVTPKRLVLQDGDTYRWMYITGDCCHEWMLEGRRHRSQLPLDDEINLQLAVDTWNGAMRWNTGEVSEKV